MYAVDKQRGVILVLEQVRRRVLERLCCDVVEAVETHWKDVASTIRMRYRCPQGCFDTAPLDKKSETWLVFCGEEKVQFGRDEIRHHNS